ncbi:hypothetical protein GCM10010468_69940 [Actinocorallia longicatena]|uniref:Uncharacterized protein n=1 Tax=Actinocorallia longicatena TaxID=111803 RepID=A0ABP6QL13_9ACTN
MKAPATVGDPVSSPGSTLFLIIVISALVIYVLIKAAALARRCPVCRGYGQIRTHRGGVAPCYFCAGSGYR